MQAAALLTLIFQNSALALVVRSTRKPEGDDEANKMYIATTAVVMAEILKFSVSFAMQHKVRHENM